MKTHFKKLKNPDYLGSWDLADQNGNFKNKIVTISKVEKKMVHDGRGNQEECVTVSFNEWGDREPLGFFSVKNSQ